MVVCFFSHRIKLEEVWNFINQIDISHSLYIYNSAYKIHYLLFTVAILPQAEYSFMSAGSLSRQRPNNPPI